MKKYSKILSVFSLIFFVIVFSSCMESSIRTRIIYLDGSGDEYAEPVREPYRLYCHAGYDNYLEIPYIPGGSGYTELYIEWYWESPTGTLATVQMVSDEYGKMASTTIWHGMQGEWYISSGACLAGATYTDWSSGGVEADCADSASKLQFFIQDGNNNWEAVYGTIYIQKIWLSGSWNKDRVLFEATNYSLPEKISLKTSISTESLTNSDVLIRVYTSKLNISRIGYVYSEYYKDFYDAYSILNNPYFNYIDGNEYGEFKINATANGYYYIAAEDTKGYTTYKQVYISNIDKTPPSSVTNFYAEYDEFERKIIITWTNPSDSDFDHSELSYTKNGVTVEDSISVSDGRYELENIDNSDAEYIFSVCAVDEVGNKSSYSTSSITIEKQMPAFTSFNIPSVSVANAGNTVTATVIGENFNSKLNFNYSWGGDLGYPSLSVRNSNLIYITFTIPAYTGDYSFSVSSEDISISGTLKVGDFSSYSVGDVLLNDGTIIPYDAENLSFTDEQKEAAVGVLYGFNEYGAPLGYLGIYNSAGGTNSGVYQWAPYGTTGYDTEFYGIICYPSNYGNPETANTATFVGDKNGSDNWDLICLIDPDGITNPALNYPAFNYINNYASTFNLIGDYATGWYMPSIAELCNIYRRRDRLNAVLYALETVQLSGYSYWSSSHDFNDNTCSWYIDFNTGSVNNYKKSDDRYVCCVRAFAN